MLEIRLQNQVFSKLKTTYSIVKKEVPILSRCVDLIYINDRDEIISIEVKISNWRKAVEQASEHNLVADKAYVCLPKKTRGVSEELIDLVKINGIGLFIYDTVSKELDEVVEPSIERNKWEHGRENLVELLYAQ